MNNDPVNFVDLFGLERISSLDWPTEGTFTSPYGTRTDPFTGESSLHLGIDVANEPGTPIRAAESGRVADAGYNENLGYYVVIAHDEYRWDNELGPNRPDGTPRGAFAGTTTLYAHLENEPDVQSRDHVKSGDQIGTMGNTGRSTGPHLHFGVSVDGINKDPLDYLPGNPEVGDTVGSKKNK